MKKRLMGSKKFWMVLVAILGVYIILTSVLLFFNYSNKTVSDNKNQQTVYTEQSYAETVDRSYDGTKQRVDSINSNYGQQIKSAYSGETSIMEKMIQHRIIFSTIRNVLLYAVLILVILLILVKGFQIKIFKRRFTTINQEEKCKNTKRNVNPDDKDEKKEFEPENQKPVEKDIDLKEERDVKSEDEQEIALDCQLP